MHGGGLKTSPGQELELVAPSSRPKRLSAREETTLSGGSLGSCVDEERSQLRELM